MWNIWQHLTETLLGMGYPVGLNLSVHGHCVVHRRGGLVDPHLKGRFIKLLWKQGSMRTWLWSSRFPTATVLGVTLVASQHPGTDKGDVDMKWLAPTFKLNELSDVIIQHQKWHLKSYQVLLLCRCLLPHASSAYLLWLKCGHKSPNGSNWTMRLGLQVVFRLDLRSEPPSPLRNEALWA